MYPMFRGYTQQDSQEFLRYFMDQLHEELREPVHILHEEEESEMEGMNIDLVCLLKCGNFVRKWITSIKI